MAAYPTYGQTVQSRESVLNDVSTERASNGDLRGRALWSATKRRFAVNHVLTSADKATYHTFYTTNAALAVDFTWQGNSTTYSCAFIGEPSYTPLGGGYWGVAVTLEQV